MLLLVGLGNPTPDSENNRHNVGFKIIDSINKKFGLSKQKPKFKGLLTTGNINNQKVYAIKPLTFMNNSGICIRELIEYFKIDAEEVIVFHDDLDVEFGKIKVKVGGSSAGHNGIASIDKFIGKDYSRVRIGIGKPKVNMEIADYVLQNFDDDELLGIEKISKDITDSISMLVEKKLDSEVSPTIQGRDFVIATLAAPTVMKEPEKPAEAEAAEGAEGAEGAEAAAADGDKPAAEGDKKEADEKKPAEDKK